MYWNASAASRTNRKRVMSSKAVSDAGRNRGAPDSGMLEDDLHHDVAGVAAAVHRLFDHFVQLLQNHELLGVVRTVVEVVQQREHHLVSLALGKLEPVMGLADFLDGRAAAELFHH